MEAKMKALEGKRRKIMNNARAESEEIARQMIELKQMLK
jgi:hypothetical protein